MNKNSFLREWMFEREYEIRIRRFCYCFSIACIVFLYFKIFVYQKCFRSHNSFFEFLFGFLYVLSSDLSANICLHSSFINECLCVDQATSQQKVPTNKYHHRGWLYSKSNSFVSICTMLKVYLNFLLYAKFVL